MLHSNKPLQKLVSTMLQENAFKAIRNGEGEVVTVSRFNERCYVHLSDSVNALNKAGDLI